MSIEEYNYWNDSRVRAAQERKLKLNEQTMEAEVLISLDAETWVEVMEACSTKDRDRWFQDSIRLDEEHDGIELAFWVPFTWEVCYTCNGKGTVVDPSIDAGGLTYDDFYDDPDFHEDYFGGTYDIACPRCNGRRVAPQLNTDVLPAALLRELERQDYEEAEYQAMVRMERMLGC